MMAVSSENGGQAAETRVVWATPRWGDKVTPMELVKVTAKQVKVREGTWAQTWSSDEGLPQGAMAWRSGGGADSQYLFETRAQCLTFMAARARKQAESKDREAKKLRDQANTWEVEAGRG